MGYTVDGANIELQRIINGESPAAEAELKRIISELDVTDTKANAGAKTVLYSGIEKGVIDDLAHDPSNRMLNNTSAFEFLDTIKIGSSAESVGSPRGRQVTNPMI